MTETASSVPVENDKENPPRSNDYFEDIVKQRLERRTLIKAAGAFGAGLVLRPVSGSTRDAVRPNANGGRLQFQPIAPSTLDAVVVPVNYASNVVIRWGDPLFPTAPAFDPGQQTGLSQSQQFGFNCDFIAQFPVPPSLDRQVVFDGRPSPRLLTLLGLLYPFHLKRSYATSLLWVNHEYTTGSEMFDGYSSADPSLDQVETEIEAHGGSVVAIRRQPNGAWHYDQSSPFNRRVTGTTPIRIAGPLAGHPYMRTSEDPDGYTVKGMFNNCGGGMTPWGTVLSCEENFDQYFANAAGVPEPLKSLYARLAAPSGASFRKWERYDQRFDLTEEPNEYARFGFVLEIDPYDPGSTPVKHTALGRTKHEGAAPVLTSDNRVVVYSGDDARFEYVYKFVSSGTFNRLDRERAKTLLDEGVLYAAKFNSDGSGEWLPLVAGEGPLTGANGFPTQAEILINTRGAADLVGATKMDRPEDIDVSPVTRKVYCAFTNNSQRNAGNVDAANPRPNNTWGHVIEITEDDGDNGALTFQWEILMLCGDPAVQGEFPADPRGVYFGGFDVTQVSPIGAPDNLDLDADGNLWIATDGQPSIFGHNDGIFAVPVEGPDRGFLRQFLSGVPAAEVASLKMSGDQKTLFACIQHPGEDGGLPNALSNWPDGDMPRPSVVAVRHLRGRVIGNR
jgi:secreted PhoX family phosphatase